MVKNIISDRTTSERAKPKVHIVILNWNGLKDTNACLCSLRSIDYEDFQIIVVDNGSTDQSVSEIRGTFPEVTILETGENLGFAGGNNVGIRHALNCGADHILLLNNDTVVDPQLLQHFVNASLRHAGTGVFAAKIYYHSSPHTIWYAGARWSWRHAAFVHLRFHEIDDGHASEKVTETDTACGCAMMIRADVMRSVGLLHADYFLYWEEADWCYRARQMGYRCMLVPAAKVWHKVSASVTGGENGPLFQYYYHRNQLLWIERNLGRRAMWFLLVRVIGPRRLIRFAGCLLLPFTNPAKRSKSWAALQGVWDFFRGRFGPGPAWLSTRMARK